MLNRKYKLMLKILMGILFTPGPVNNDYLHEVILTFAKKEKWVTFDKFTDRYYITDKGCKNIKKYLGGNNE